MAGSGAPGGWEQVTPQILERCSVHRRAATPRAKSLGSHVTEALVCRWPSRQMALVENHTSSSER